MVLQHNEAEEEVREEEDKERSARTSRSRAILNESTVVQQRNLSRESPCRTERLRMITMVI